MEYQDNKKIFAMNLKYYSDKNSLQQTDIANICKVTPAAVNSWFQAQKMPRMDKIEALANYFGVLKSDLIEDKNAAETDDENEHEEHYYIDPETRQIAQEIHDNADMRGLFDIARDTSPERLRAYCEFLKQLHDQDKTDE